MSGVMRAMTAVAVGASRTPWWSVDSWAMTELSTLQVRRSCYGQNLVLHTEGNNVITARKLSLLFEVFHYMFLLGVPTVSIDLVSITSRCSGEEFNLQSCGNYTASGPTSCPSAQILTIQCEGRS